MKITRIYSFAAAHKLPNVPPNHKCSRLHGHTYKLEISVAGEVGEDTGWVMDFADIDKHVNPLIEASLDHHYLNDQVENPTVENLVLFLKKQLPESFSIKAWEGDRSYAEID